MSQTNTTTRVPRVSRFDDPSRVSRVSRHDAPSPEFDEGFVQETRTEQMKLEDQLTNDKLKKLQQTFEEADEDGGGGLDMDEFRNAMRKTLGDHLTDHELDMMFMKVDTNCDGTVDWDEYLSYMLLEYREKDQMNFSAKERPFPPNNGRCVEEMSQKHKHHDTVVNILFTPGVKKMTNALYRPDDENNGRFVTVSKEGIVNFWSPDMKHIKKYEIEARHRSGVWVTAAVILPNVHMLAVATTKCTIAFYDLQSHVNKFSVNAVLCDLEIVATAMDYWYNPESLETAMLLWGDLRGNVYILSFQGCRQMCALYPLMNKKKDAQIQLMDIEDGSVCGVTLTKILSAHTDIVLQIRYIPVLEVFMSCCRDDFNALLMSDIQTKRPSYFRQNKGVFTFDYSEAHNLIVTAGKDSIVRIWNPYVTTKPVIMLQGHTDTVIYVRIDEKKEQVISISEKKDIHIYDLNTQTCIQNIHRKFVRLGSRPITAVYFHTYKNALMLATNKMVIFQHKEDNLRTQQWISHPAPVTCVLYNKLFHQVVSGGVDSKVMVWDVETGEKMMQFTAHSEYRDGKLFNITITAMSFDTTQRRLVTAARNGAVKIWNFNNGACLRVLEEGSTANIEVTGIAWPLHRIITSGWSQQLVCYMDAGDDETVRYWDKYHQEDIMVIAFNEPLTIATASFDGDIIIWSLDACLPVMRFNAGESPFAQLCGKSSGDDEFDKGDEKDEDHEERINEESKQETPVFDDAMLNNNATTNPERHIKFKFPLSKINDRHSFSVLKKSAIRHRTVSTAVTNRLTSNKPTFTSLDGQLSLMDQKKLSTLSNSETHGSHVHLYTNVLLFLKSRKSTKDTATLVSAGVGGWVYFWSVHHKGGLQGIFNAAHFACQDITALATDPTNTKLITGDVSGYIKVWDIVGYCCRLSKGERYSSQVKLVKQFPFLRIEPSLRRTIQNQRRHGEPMQSTDPQRTHKIPMLLNSFQAHLKTVTKLHYIEDGNIILSSSADCSLRMHSIVGDFIGIFNHPETWKNCPYKGVRNVTSLSNKLSKMSKQGNRMTKLKTLYYNKNFPPDIRRIASSTTLKVLYGGVRPLQTLIKKVIWTLVPMFLKYDKLDNNEEQDEDNPEQSSIHELESAGDYKPLLSENFKVMRKHQPLPAIQKPRMFADQCAVYSSLPCYELEQVSAELAPPQIIKEIQERQALMARIKHVKNRNDHQQRKRIKMRRQSRLAPLIMKRSSMGNFTFPPLLKN